MKTCSKCGVEKEDAEFRKHRRGCRACEKAYGKAYEKTRSPRAVNLEDCRERSRRHYWKNPQKRNAPRAAAQKKKYNSDSSFRLMRLLRTRVTNALAGKSKKSAKTTELIGCPWVWAEVHLESLFKPGMTWENHGPVWHVDHIKPCAAFDLRDPEQQKACFHWSNLQPLFVLENLQKSDKYAPPEYISGLVLG